MEAPLHLDVADAPAHGKAYFATAADGTRIRFAYWDGSGGDTVFLMPGRSEYIEKYGQVVTRITDLGLGCVVLDWRNQGLSDRAARAGHVESYLDYQVDFKAVLAAPQLAHLNRPYHLLAHSMGGLIALRSLQAGHDFKSVLFSAPMWGLGLPPSLRQSLKTFARLSPLLGLQEQRVIGTNKGPYVLVGDPKTNTLTSDVPTFNWIKRQLTAHPELGLGGASWGWLKASHQEIMDLRNFAVPDVPTLTFLGSDERVVNPVPVHQRMADMPEKLVMIKGARHEVLMETPDVQAKIWPAMARHWGLPTA